MECHKVLSLLSEYYDGELGAAEADIIESHLAACSHCSREFGALRRTAELLSSATELEPPAYLLRQIGAATVDKPNLRTRLREYFMPLRRSKRLTKWITVGVAVTSMFIAVFASWFYGARNPGANPVAIQNPSSVINAQPSQPEIRVTEIPKTSASSDSERVLTGKRSLRLQHRSRVVRRPADTLVVKPTPGPSKMAIPTMPTTSDETTTVPSTVDNPGAEAVDITAENQDDSIASTATKPSDAEVVKVTRPVDAEIEARLKKQAEELEKWRAKLASANKKYSFSVNASEQRTCSVDLATISF